MSYNQDAPNGANRAGVFKQGLLKRTLRCAICFVNDNNNPAPNLNLAYMIPKLEGYYASKPEPYQSCLLALRDIILSVDEDIVHERKFQIPFFSYKNKKLGYLWLNGKKLMLGFCIDKSLLPQMEGVKPKDQYESFRINPNEDIPIDFIIDKINTYLQRINAA